MHYDLLLVLSALMAHRLIEQARCLTHVFHDYMSCGKYRNALLTVLQQVNKVEEVNSDLHEVSHTEVHQSYGLFIALIA